jgi:hypothetical protein
VCSEIRGLKDLELTSFSGDGHLNTGLRENIREKKDD